MTSSDANRTMNEKRALAGGVVLLLSLQYFVAERIVAAAWTKAPYSFSRNYISDLGVPECLELPDRVVCSPLHAVMNSSFVLQGLIAALCAIVLRHGLSRGAGRWALALVLTYSVGTILVGLFPGSTEEVIGGRLRGTLHVVGAVLSAFGGNVGALVVGGALLRGRTPVKSITARAPAGRSVPRTILGTFVLLCGAVGVAGTALWFTGADLGLGIGTVERIGIDPIIAWFVAVGLATLFARPRRR